MKTTSTNRGRRSDLKRHHVNVYLKKGGMKRLEEAQKAFQVLSPNGDIAHPPKGEVIDAALKLFVRMIRRGEYVGGDIKRSYERGKKKRFVCQVDPANGEPLEYVKVYESAGRRIGRVSWHPWGEEERPWFAKKRHVRVKYFGPASGEPGAESEEGEENSKS